MEAYLKQLLQVALKEQVSDIHFVVKEKAVAVSMRKPAGLFPCDIPCEARFIAFLRYKAGLDLSFSSLPQTGQLECRIDQQVVSLRFSYLTTNRIETGVLRILNHALRIQLDELSFLSYQNQKFKQVAAAPQGLILLSGPTGCGKTTTLYALLAYIRATMQRNIMTLEDPIEMYQEGLIQIQVNEQRQLTYEGALKQLLRHDPDVIMVGEIRDEKTAHLVIRGALTGHLVLSSIHATDCEGVIARMQELGVSRTDLEQTLLCITSQRILKGRTKNRKVCIYEIMEREQIQQYMQGSTASHERLDDIMAKAVLQKQITKTEANKEQLYNR